MSVLFLGLLLLLLLLGIGVRIRAALAKAAFQAALTREDLAASGFTGMAGNACPSH